MSVHRTVSSLPLLAAIAAVAAPLGAATYTVGASPVDCDFTSLVLAVAFVETTADSDELRLTRTLAYSNVNLFFSNWDTAATGNLTFSGGWDDCLDATPAGDTLVDGTPGGVVFEVAEDGSSATALTLVLRDLEIVGANTGVAVSGAAGPGSPAKVVLESSVAHSNEHGVAASNGARAEIDSASVVRDNVATTPGGLFGAGVICMDSGTEVELAATIRDNSVASGFPSTGGGLYVTGGCVATLLPGTVIEGNHAASGGGIGVTIGGRVEGGGDALAAVWISGNSAIAGGGIMAWSTGSVVSLANVRIESNVAREAAGIYAESGALVELRRAAGRACPDAPRCLTLSHNQLTDDAESEGFGSAVMVINGGEFRMFRGFIEGNGGFGEAGSLVFSYTHSNTIELEGVQVWNNRARWLFLSASNDSSLVGGFLTVAGNSYWDPGTSAYLDSIPAYAGSSATIEFFTSIFKDHQAWQQAGGTSEIHVDCLILDTTEGTTSAGANMVGWDPRFRDAAIGDLRLLPDSPAIDACDDLLYSPAHRDYDHDLRGFDSLTRTNILGPFDRGADESPLLFASGFESGNLSGWSATSP